jgi:leucyl-tRNA synthetase
MRYMDAHNENEFASKDALAYWESVDLYIGGSEHATGHLLYSRFWNKFLKDKGFAPTEEPFKKLINQGMILGMSAFVYRISFTFGIASEGNNEVVETLKKIPTVFISHEKLKKNDQVLNGLLSTIKLKDEVISIVKKRTQLPDEFLNNLVPFISGIHVDLKVINEITNELDIETFKNHPLYSDYKDAEFITEENGKYIVGREIEKMSKSKYNVVTPDDICNEYGADTLRLYEMFLGPLEQAKPWNTAGISGVFGFLKKLWRLYFDENGLIVNNDTPTKDNLKSLHKTIKKVAEDIEGFSFNTSVSQFMICVNELSTQNCHSRAILEPLTVLISSYAPHIAEELWSQLGNSGSISTVDFPTLDEKHLVESSKEYPVSFNGKMRFTIELPLDLSKEQIEEIIMKDERTLKQLDGKIPNKIIIVPGKVINLVG